MKKQGIWILVAIIAVAVVLILPYSLQGKGTINIETPGVELRIRSGWLSTATIRSDSGPVQVKAGIYHPMQAAMRATKKDGDTRQQWSMASARGPWGKLAMIRVDKGQTVTLRLGPPITLHADVQRQGSTVLVGLALVGQAGEHWSPRVMTSQGQAPPPTVRIVDESGTVLASGKFAYG